MQLGDRTSQLALRGLEVLTLGHSVIVAATEPKLRLRVRDQSGAESLIKRAWSATASASCRTTHTSRGSLNHSRALSYE